MRAPAALAAVVAGLALSGAAVAQPWPARPLTLVVPFAPGGITDILARSLGQKLTDAWGQQVVIENKPGANSQIGAELVAKAPPDGYTLLVSADTTFVMNPHLYAKLSYDPVKDFAPVTGLGISPQALVVHPSAVGAKRSSSPARRATASSPSRKSTASTRGSGSRRAASSRSSSGVSSVR